MSELGYEKAMTERNARANDDVKSCETKSIREKFEKEKRTTGDARRSAAAAASATDLRRANDTGCALTANNRRHGDVDPRDPPLSSVETSGCQSNVHTAKPMKPTVKRATSTIKLKKTDIFKRQLSHEVVMLKTPEEKCDVCPKTLAPSPVPTLIFEPKTNESDTSLLECHKGVQDDLLDDGHVNLNNNESMEQVDTNCYSSSEVGDENSNFDAVGMMENDTSDEQVNEDTSHVFETSDTTLVGERELDDEFVTSGLEAESNGLLEKPGDPVVFELSHESPEYSELQTSSLNGTVPVLDYDQERVESTKSLRARFEALHNDRPSHRPTPRANGISQRFENLVTTKCEVCEKKVYPLEKIELESRAYHKACFRCSHCQCLLRMDSFTKNCNRLYCMPHFKQLFKNKGSYDQGFSDDM